MRIGVFVFWAMFCGVCGLIFDTVILLVFDLPKACDTYFYEELFFVVCVSSVYGFAAGASVAGIHDGYCFKAELSRCRRCISDG